MTRAIRRGYETVSRYAPDESPVRLDLSDNTNAWGMPPSAVDAIQRAGASARYPSAYADDLKAAIADYTGATPDMITTGCGSDDVLDSAMRALAEPGEQLAYMTPTFPMIPVFARVNGLVPVASRLDEVGRYGERLVYLCSPNNPTGSAVPRDRIEAILRHNDDQIVIVDEAYAEFAGSSVVDLAMTSDRLIVTRTLSKAFGLAGMRVGYAIGNPSVIGEIEKSRGPYKVAGLSERAAVAALTDGRAWVMEHVTLAAEMRARLVAALRGRGLEPLDSSANFVFVPIANAVAIGRQMRRAGVAVRTVENPPGLRITVAPWPMLADVLSTLDEARAACA